VIVIDPPWRFGDKLPGVTRGAEKNYVCMYADEVVPHLQAQTLGHGNIACFCWRVASMQHEALKVLSACQLTIKSELVWEKLTKSGKPFFGMGRYVRASHEVCLIATRGKAMPEVRNQRSRFSAVVREHSRKPEEFYAIVERMYPSSTKVELFARTPRAGWTQHGLELGKFVVAQ
jgi:N6-adenosine-specific RNA methylase IME4